MDGTMKQIQKNEILVRVTGVVELVVVYVEKVPGNTNENSTSKSLGGAGWIIRLFAFSTRRSGSHTVKSNR